MDTLARKREEACSGVNGSPPGEKGAFSGVKLCAWLWEVRRKKNGWICSKFNQVCLCCLRPNARLLMPLAGFESPIFWRRGRQRSSEGSGSEEKRIRFEIKFSIDYDVETNGMHLLNIWKLIKIKVLFQFSRNLSRYVSWELKPVSYIWPQTCRIPWIPFPFWYDGW